MPLHEPTPLAPCSTRFPVDGGVGGEAAATSGSGVKGGSGSGDRHPAMTSGSKLHPAMQVPTLVPKLALQV